LSDENVEKKEEPVNEIQDETVADSSAGQQVETKSEEKKEEEQGEPVEEEAPVSDAGSSDSAPDAAEAESKEAEQPVAEAEVKTEAETDARAETGAATAAAAKTGADAQKVTETPKTDAEHPPDTRPGTGVRRPYYGGPQRSGSYGRGGDRRPNGDGDRSRGRYKVYFRKKVCKFCTKKITIHYLDYETLRRFTTDRGKMLPARITGNCAKHQRQLAKAIKRARSLALLPYATR
jgi:small subunit ribosomal protein S18